jgi:hypothetical protein
MTSDWTPIFVLPNIPHDAPIGCELAALAPANDRRAAALKRTHPMFRRFLNRFADQMGFLGPQKEAEEALLTASDGSGPSVPDDRGP